MENHSCPQSLDDHMNWTSTVTGSTLTIQCPFTFCSDCTLQEKFRQASRRCNESGFWERPNFTMCYDIEDFHTDCIHTPCNPCPLPAFRELVQVVTVVLCGLSLLCLAVSLAIFSSFKTLNCCRLTIHKHLCAIFVFRFCTMITWILLWKHRIFVGCGYFSKETLDPVCKILLFSIMYATMASINWMFVEGVHLASRISIFVFNTTNPMAAFNFIGWGIPFLWVTAWALLMENSSRSRSCWLPYSTSHHKWLLIAPMLVTLIVNLLLLVLIVAILIKKLTATNVEEPKKLCSSHMEQSYFRKATKATLILMPLLGLTNLLWFVEPPERDSNSFRAYILFNTVVQHSQGVFIATIYCFFNAEVRQLLTRTKDAYFHHGWTRGQKQSTLSKRKDENVLPRTPSSNLIAVTEC